MRLVAVLGILPGVVATLLVSVSPALAAEPGTLSVLVTTGHGRPLAGVTVSADGRTAVTGGDGRTAMAGVAPGPVEVSHPAHGSRVVTWTGEGDRLRVPLGTPLVRALHVTGGLPGTARWQELLALADATAVNAFMLDMKDESGRVFPHSASSWAHAAGAVQGWWSLPAVVDELHGRGLAVVVRIVTFQDPIAGRRLPGMAAWNTATNGPLSRWGQVFLDPTDTDAREYALQLAGEVCASGADEVQFDYVRFPDGSKVGIRFDGGSGTDPAVRVAAVTSFLREARARVAPGCRVAADVFGFVTSIDGDGGIGQRLEDLAAEVDVISPMVYPNHWASGWFGFRTPADHPGPVVTASMSNARDRVGDVTELRPWLQDFGGYGSAEVRAQVHAADDLGMGWMIWNANSEFTPGGIPTDGELAPAVPPDPEHEHLPASGFWDVTDSGPFLAEIRWLAATGTTKGCNAPWGDEFCPDRPLTRGEAASLLARALDLAPSAVDAFDDDDGSVHEADIDALAAAGITIGCGPRTFCPGRTLTREEAAALFARALDLPASTADTFTDDDGSVLEDEIERLFAAGVTRGCAPGRFCPGDPLTREEAAAFLYRALA